MMKVNLGYQNVALPLELANQNDYIDTSPGQPVFEL